MGVQLEIAVGIVMLIGALICLPFALGALIFVLALIKENPGVVAFLIGAVALISGGIFGMLFAVGAMAIFAFVWVMFAAAFFPDDAEKAKRAKADDEEKVKRSNVDAEAKFEAEIRAKLNADIKANPNMLPKVGLKVRIINFALGTLVCIMVLGFVMAGIAWLQEAKEAMLVGIWAGILSLITMGPLASVIENNIEAKTREDALKKLIADRLAAGKANTESFEEAN